MTRYPISGCSFISNCIDGAFVLFESMAGVLALCDEYVVMDLGSTDGTLGLLERIAQANPRVKLKRGTWPSTDANAFAVLANDLMRHHCQHPVCWYHQADEVWHEDLLRMARDRFEAGETDLAFWRIQYGYNWQDVRWFPHVIHRVGEKGARFNFVGDGMNSDRFMEPPICSDYGGSYFMKWGEMGPEGIKPYVDQMVMDVSLLGGFRDNIVERRALHAPFWHEEPVVPYRAVGQKRDEQLPASEWTRRALVDDRWTRKESPYSIPGVMKWHVGRTRYEIREELIRALCEDRTARFVGLE